MDKILEMSKRVPLVLARIVSLQYTTGSEIERLSAQTEDKIEKWTWFSFYGFATNQRGTATITIIESGWMHEWMNRPMVGWLVGWFVRYKLNECLNLSWMAKFPEKNQLFLRQYTDPSLSWTLFACLMKCDVHTFTDAWEMKFVLVSRTTHYCIWK